MKKLITSICALALVAALAVPAAALDIDLSALTYDELIELRKQAMYELLSRDEFEEVEVPQGVWRVGEDIPAGKWTIRCTVSRGATIAWGTNLNASGDDIDYYSGKRNSVHLANKNSNSWDYPIEYVLEVEEGDYIVIDNGFGSVTFFTYKGQPELGFKKK